MKEEHNVEEGNTQAFKEGEEKGIKKGEEKTARNLKALGTLTEKQIASVTGLTVKAVKAL